MYEWRGREGWRESIKVAGSVTEANIKDWIVTLLLIGMGVGGCAGRAAHRVNPSGYQRASRYMPGKGKRSICSERRVLRLETCVRGDP